MRRRPGLVAVTLLLSVVVAVPAGAHDVGGDLEDVTERIDDLAAVVGSREGARTAAAAEIVEAKARRNVLLGELAAAKSAFAEAEREHNLAIVEHRAVQEDLQRSYLQLAETRRSIDAGREEAISWARQVYMSAGQQIPASAMDAASIADISITLAYMERVAESNEAIVARLVALEDQESAQQELIVAQEADLVLEVQQLADTEDLMGAIRDEITARTAAVESELHAQRHLLAEIDADIAELEGEIAGLEKEQARLERLLAEQQSGGGVSPAGFVRPVPGAITSPFGLRFHPILGYTRMHTGVDMTAPFGQPIKAVAAGRVILSASYGGYGNTIIIDHGGGMATLYAHLSSFDIRYGSEVAQGQVIGDAGASGLSTGPHLHFEVRLSGRPVNPAPYLEGT